MSEEQLISQILKGDTTAFEALFNEYQLKILNLCYAMLHNREEAEDLTQEVFLEIYRSLDKFQNKCKLSTWIYRIAYNHTINYIKSKSNRLSKNNSSFEPITVNLPQFLHK